MQYLARVRSADAIELVCPFEARSGSQAAQARTQLEAFATTRCAKDLLAHGYSNPNATPPRTYPQPTHDLPLYIAA